MSAKCQQKALNRRKVHFCSEPFLDNNEIKISCIPDLLSKDLKFVYLQIRFC